MTRTPAVTVIVVNHDGGAMLSDCLRALRRTRYPRAALQVLVVDNASTDASRRILERHRWVETIPLARNDYCAANNAGLRRARGRYVVFLNNDTEVEPLWLRALLRVAESDRRVGAVGAKLLLPDGRLQGTGHEPLGRHYVRDRGFGEEDRGQYDGATELDSVCHAAALYRRDTLRRLGGFDEDFVMYYEDVELGHRLRASGAKVRFAPASRVRHRFHGTSARYGVENFYGNRNRLLFVAKHRPDDLVRSVFTSQFYENHDIEYLYAVAPDLMRKLLRSHPRARAEGAVRSLLRAYREIFDGPTVSRLARRYEVMSGRRRARVAVYDHALSFVGGGQQYVLTMADAIRATHEVTYLTHAPVDRRQMSAWHALPFPYHVRTIPLPYYQVRRTRELNKGYVRNPRCNPFDAVARVAQEYDVFINGNMMDRVRPMANHNVFVCHFPDSPLDEVCYARDYDETLTNSRYTGGWVERLWKYRPDHCLYPPVSAVAPAWRKRNLILSVARFEEEGSKKQVEMVGAFAALCRSHPRIARDWELLLVGGAIRNGRYYARVAAEVAAHGAGLPVRMLVNLPRRSLLRLYREARIFWHLCGLGETAPHRIEHFGMATVEAMQNGVVPIVFRGGGQLEILEHGVHGFFAGSQEELLRHTLRLVRSPGLLAHMARSARVRGRAFSPGPFRAWVRRWFDDLAREVRDPAPPSVEAVAHGRLLERLRRDGRIRERR